MDISVDSQHATPWAHLVFHKNCLQTSFGDIKLFPPTAVLYVVRSIYDPSPIYDGITRSVAPPKAPKSRGVCASIATTLSEGAIGGGAPVTALEDSRDGLL